MVITMSHICLELRMGAPIDFFFSVHESLSQASVGMREVSGVCQRVTMLTPFSDRSSVFFFGRTLCGANMPLERSLYGKEREPNELWR